MFVYFFAVVYVDYCILENRVRSIEIYYAYNDVLHSIKCEEFLVLEIVIR